MIYLEFHLTEATPFKRVFDNYKEAYEFLYRYTRFCKLREIGTEESTNCTWFYYHDGSEAKMYEIKVSKDSKIKTFEDLKFTSFDNSIIGKGARAFLHFPNTYGICVLLGKHFASNGIDTYEVGILKEGNVHNHKTINGDMLNNLTKEEVTEIMKEIQEL